MAKSEAVVTPTYDELVAKVDMLTKANENLADTAAGIVKERDELEAALKEAREDLENETTAAEAVNDLYDKLKLSHDELAARVIELSGREVPGVNPETHAAVVAECDKLRAAVEKLQRPTMHGSIDDLKPVV